MDTTAEAYMYAGVQMMGDRAGGIERFERGRTETENLRRARSAHPRHFELTEEMLELASEALLTFREHSHGPSHASDVEVVTNLLFMKSYKSLWSVIVLCERRLADDAAIVLRSLFNLLVVARWVRKQPQRVAWYLQWFGIGTSKLIGDPERLRKFPPLAEDFAEAEEFFRREGPTPGRSPDQWHGSSIKVMAEQVGLEEHYQVVYRSLSSTEHSDVMSYLPMLQGGSSPGFSLWSDRMIDDYLALAFCYFGLVFKEWNEMFGVLEPTRIQALADRGPELLRPLSSDEGGSGQ
jgi:hypothetical protein